jgi:hypothetical protein
MKNTEQKTEHTLTQRLLEFQKQVNVIKKDAKNPHFKNTYATLKQVLSEVKPILSEVGLLITQPIDERGIGTVITDGKDSISSFIPMPTGLAPQQLGSCVSYFRRYTVCSLLSLEIDDDDANQTRLPLATKDVIEKAKAGKYTLEQIRSKYTVTKEMEAYYESI